MYNLCHCKIGTGHLQVKKAVTALLGVANVKKTLCRPFAGKTKLEHIGILNESSQVAKYESGQTFLHRVFAYRGVILHPWTAQVYTRNSDLSPYTSENKSKIMKQPIPKMETYYQVLVDTRDSPNTSAKYGITFLKNQGKENYPLEAITNIDYVSHRDIIPYISVEHTPIHHHLFDKFLVKSKNHTLQRSESLTKWQKKNEVWLELSNVHIETTENIRVTVIPFFLGVKAIAPPSVYWWRYCIRIENLGSTSVKLRKRYWRIISNGSVTKESGYGVVGEEPVLSNENPAFQYISQVPLLTPSGHMWGTYLFERDGGEQFDVKIPAFSLQSKSETHSNNMDIE